MPVLTVIRTAPPGGGGSMSAYGDMVVRALAATPGGGLTLRWCDAYPPGAGRLGGMWGGHLWRALHLRRALLAAPADAYHLLDGSLAAFLPAALRARSLVSVHDLIPLLQWRGALPGRPSLPAGWLIGRTARALGGCLALAADSACTRGDVERLLGRRDVRVIPLAVKPLSGSGARPGGGVGGRRVILHVGHNGAYKNRRGVLEVFGRLRDLDGLELVMVGPKPTAALRRAAKAVGRVRFVVDVDEAALVAWYQEAALLLFPSLYEGFGMPVLEAMSLRCPVVCSEGGALPEVVGGAALTAPVGADAALAAHCRALLGDGVLRERMIAAGWQRASLYSSERLGIALRAWYQDMMGSRSCAS